MCYWLMIEETHHVMVTIIVVLLRSLMTRDARYVASEPLEGHGRECDPVKEVLIISNKLPSLSIMRH